MKKITKRLFILFCAFVVALLGPAAGLMRHNVTAAGADELISQINAVPGLSAAVSGTNEITVTGSADIGRTRLNLDVDFGVTVKWKANITGAATQNNYAIGLSGGGVFELSGAVLTNTGAGGTVYISGTITLDVGTGGLIESPSSAGSAVTIAGDVKNTIINVGNGGKILSVPGGYAINDGSSFTQCENNTKINVNQNGSLEAGTAGAVRSTGKFSVVTVEAGGLVTSSPASNVSPVISMNCDPPPDSPIENVVINGGTVRTTNSGAMSFVIQTSQSIKVNDGLVQSIAGRAINLVGMNSVATINGGKVTTVSGVAVSVATSTIGKVENAKIEVKGGKVEATGSGDAIHITDVGNTVTVSGGQVVARNGYAIDVEARVSGNPVVVNGGIVFSWGINIGDVINRGGTKLDPIVGGVIADWNTATGFGTVPYHQGESDDLVFLPLGAGVYWDINPESSAPYDGIRYNGEFFGLNAEVIQEWFILTIYDGSGNKQVRSVKAGAVENISAHPESPPDPLLVPPYNYPINGTVFSKWTTNSGGTFGDENAPATQFTMPKNDVTISAAYKPRYLLHVIGGGIDTGYINYGGSVSYGYYAQGEMVAIHRNSTSDKWESTNGGDFTDETAANTTFAMPGNETMIQGIPGTYTRPQPSPCAVEIINGSGVITGTSVLTFSDTTKYEGYPGTNLKIQARGAADENEAFSHWKIISGNGFFENPFDDKTAFVMLGNATIEAVFDKFYVLTVENGSGSGIYKEGDVVNITASLMRGKSFSGWTNSYAADLFDNDDAASRSTGFTMPAANVTVSAAYTPILYDVWAWNGSPASSGYYADEPVTVTADAPENGMEFDGWVVIYGDVSISDLTSQTISFVMPADDVILMATYTETIVPLPPITPEPTTPEPTTTTETPQTDPGSDSSPDDDKNDEEEDEEEDDNKTETTTEDETTTEPTIDEEEQEQEEEVDDEGEGDDEEEGDEDIEYEEDEAPSKKPGFGPGEEPSTEPTIDEVQNGEDGAPAATEDKPANGPTLSQTDDSLMTSAIPVTNYPPYPSAPPTPPPANSVTITTPGGDIVELEYHGQIPDSATLLPNGWGAAELDEGIWEIFGDDGKTIGFVWYDGENIKKWENFDEMILIETLLQTQEPFGNPAAGNETKEDKGNPNTGDVLPFAIVLALAGALPGIFAVKYKKKRS